MQCDLSDIKIIRSQMRYNRNIEVRKKVILFLLAFRYRNISLACQKLGYQRSFFYFWFNRLKEANFDISINAYAIDLFRMSRSNSESASKAPLFSFLIFLLCSLLC